MVAPGRDSAPVGRRLDLRRPWREFRLGRQRTTDHVPYRNVRCMPWRDSLSRGQSRRRFLDVAATFLELRALQLIADDGEWCSPS